MNNLKKKPAYATYNPEQTLHLYRESQGFQKVKVLLNDKQTARYYLNYRPNSFGGKIPMKMSSSASGPVIADLSYGANNSAIKHYPTGSNISWRCNRKWFSNEYEFIYGNQTYIWKTGGHTWTLFQGTSRIAVFTPCFWAIDKIGKIQIQSCNQNLLDLITASFYLILVIETECITPASSNPNFEAVSLKMKFESLVACSLKA